MSFLFSKAEERKLHASWLAWKDITTREFLEGFSSLFDLTIKEVEAILEQCNCDYRLRDVRKVGLAIQPSVSFAFSPFKKGYFLNVWSFLFCLMKEESSIFFRPAFLLANELVHEYAHYRFWRDHDMLDADREDMSQFGSEHGLENEKYALTEEATFLRRVRYVVPNNIRMKLFRVQSWTSDGTPICEGKPAKMPTRKNINSAIRSIERAIQGLSSKEIYDKRMTKQKTENHTNISSILKLDIAGKDWPIVEMQI